MTGSGTGSFAATVVTNANLTGPITSTGNATAVASQTGTGSTFVMNTSPTLVTPLLGTPTSGDLSNCTFPTLNQNTTGSAATLTTARTIGGTSFNGSANITVATATGGFTVSGGDLALGANNITMSGSVGVTGTRVTKGWFTDLESTNAPTLGGVAMPSISSTNTITNKRNQPRIVSATSYTTDTGTSLDVSTTDIFVITAQAGALLFNSPSGTPVQGEKLVIRIKDNGTARALTWNAVFRAMGTALPSTTVLSKTLYLGFFYNSTDTKWDLVASAQEA